MNDLKLDFDRAHAEATCSRTPCPDRSRTSWSSTSRWRDGSTANSEGKRRPQDLSADDRGTAVVGDPGHHGRRHLRRGRSGDAERRAIPRLRAPGDYWPWCDLLSNRFGRHYPTAVARKSPALIVAAPRPAASRRRQPDDSNCLEEPRPAGHASARHRRALGGWLDEPRPGHRSRSTRRRMQSSAGPLHDAGGRRADGDGRRPQRRPGRWRSSARTEARRSRAG